MVKIPYYERDNTILANAQQSGIRGPDPDMLKYQNHAADKLAKAAGDLFTTVGEQVKQAEDAALIEQEKVGMMEHFFSLEDEVKKLPREEQLGYFKQKAEEYKAGLHERVQDSKIRGMLDNAYLSDYERGMYGIHKAGLEALASEGIAAADKGDATFLNNIKRWEGTPQLMYQELDKRMMSYDELVKAGHMRADVAQNKKEALSQRAEWTWTRYLIERDPNAALAKLNNADEFQYLGSARPELINAAQAEIKRIEAQRKHEAALAHQQRSIDFGLDMQQANQTMQELTAKGAPPKDFDAVMSRIASYKTDGGALGKQATLVYEKMKEARMDVGEVISFKSQPFMAQEKFIVDNMGRYNGGDMTTDEKRVFERKMMVYEAGDKARVSGNHLEFGEKFGIIPGVKPLNPNDPESIKQRLNDVKTMEQHLGGKAFMLTDAEAKSLATGFANGTTLQQREIGKVIGSLSEGKPERIKQILKQIKVKDETIVEEMGALARGDTALAETMSKGRREYTNNKDRLGATGEKLNVAINKLLDEANVGVLDRDGVMRKSMISGLRSTYFGLVGSTLESSEVDGNTLKKATDMYLGGLVSINGEKTVPFVQGDSEEAHQRYWKALDADLLKKAHGADAMPKYFGASGLVDVPMDKVVSNARLIPGWDGKYALGYATSDGIKLLAGDNGQPYLVDMAKIGMALKELSKSPNHSFWDFR